MGIVLPHGILFRSGAEGEIRKRLIDKNYIDTIIGLPSNLFTNTGIPVVVLILKKNRKLGEPVLIIDASKDFIKVGKQNVLQEKHVAKIVDSYLDRSDINGYTSLAYREDILENDYNMNIPRYVTSKSDEIDHDVDAHLLGGIPEKDIENLKIINSLVPQVLTSALKPLRKGYVQLTKEISQLMDEIIASEKVKAKTEEMSKKIKTFINKYWDILIQVNIQSDMDKIMEEMVDLIQKPLKDELETLKLLDNRYKSTLNDLDKEYNELEADFKNLLSQLLIV